MEPLFRLCLIRPPAVEELDRPPIALGQSSPFQNDLARTRGANIENAGQRLALGFVESEQFSGRAGGFNSRLDALGKALDALIAEGSITRERLSAAIESALGAEPGALVVDADYIGYIANLRDSILALKEAPCDQRRLLGGLTRQLRDAALITTLVGDAAFPSGPEEVARVRRRALKLPDFAARRDRRLTEVSSGRRRDAQAAADARQSEYEKALKARNGVNLALQEILTLRGEDFIATDHAASDMVAPPSTLSLLNRYTRGAEYLDALRGSAHKLVAARAAGDGQNQFFPAFGLGAKFAAALREPDQFVLAGRTAFKPVSGNSATLMLSRATIGRLSQTTTALFDQLAVSPQSFSAEHLVDALRGHLTDLNTRIEYLYGEPTRRTIRRIGSTLVTIAEPGRSVWASPALPGVLPLEPAAPSVAQMGTVAPAGVADLIIVRQQLVRYERIDIAHIENVLKGETKRREHIRHDRTVQTIYREDETTTEDERELESTSRSEMTRETQETLKEDAARKAGVTISAQYGPGVEFSLSAEVTVSRAKEAATRTASNYSKEVTERSAHKITERVLQSTTLQITNDVTETNFHELSAEGENIAGVYQWLNKVYQAQMFNYGLRTMFDFMVPEPAAMLIESFKAAHAHASELQKPPAFALLPSQVSEDNYGFWAHTYGATDIAPPPEEYRTKALDLKAGEGDRHANYTHSGQIAIDDGYCAVQGAVIAVRTLWSTDCAVDVGLGQRHTRLELGEWRWITPLDGERDAIPFALSTFNVAQVAVAVEVKCRRTERAMKAWRADTHAKLMTAYLTREREYQDKLAALELQATATIQGANPAINLDLMRDELKKNCISILTRQHFDDFNAIDAGGPTGGVPQIDIDEARIEGAFVRFFEQAFEWENLTWVAYPYFWGRKSTWAERICYEDTDPLFNQFLKAGYCRVTVPARPGFEGAIDHFLHYGEVWNGGPLPPISSDLYLPIAEELAAQLDRPQGEVAQGEPWIVRIPTTLVMLRAEGDLPEWVQGEDGEWTEDQEP